MAFELLNVGQTSQADAMAGVAGLELMEAAGMAVALSIAKRWPRRLVTVLCGPGNNGGDGFVIARHLVKRGWPVSLYLFGKSQELKGDAAFNTKRWNGEIFPLSLNAIEASPLIVDALFGAGLSRPLSGSAAEIIEAINARNLDCVAVDVPSGVLGDTGEILGAAPNCRLTVTFFRKKPAHCLYPARARMGEIVLADIGIPESVLESIKPASWEIDPSLWNFPRPGPESHKFNRGNALIRGGLEMTGASRLAARAARRAGAGLLTLAVPAKAAPIYAIDQPGALIATLNSKNDFSELLADSRRNAILVGPGCGVTEATRYDSVAALKTQRSVVLDADALSVFSKKPTSLFKAIQGPCVLTPHEGEFSRLFPDLTGSRIIRARAASLRSGAVIVLKGPDSLVTAPDGRTAIATNAPFNLATGGSGDVLAGIILGLLAQGMEAFAAAMAGVWLHGQAGRLVGRGLIAEDIPEALPTVLSGCSP
jgi:hydroxyethylthiazole kinase-like uncharacterized protein yjeF